MVKKILAIVFLLWACTNSGKEKEEDELIQDSIVLLAPDSLLIWEVNPDSLTMKKYIELPDSLITAEKIINGLNQKYSQVILEKLKQSNDTLFTIVRDSEFLGERMGSSGASAWIADVVLNLSSVPGINYVKVDMKEHSHSSPGVWSRNDFADYKKL